MSELAVTDSCDTLVIGAGALGLMTALRLARRGVDVIVADRGLPMSEASGVNAGSLAAQNKLLSLIPHTLAALELWRGMESFLGADVGFSNPGGYRVATSDSDREVLKRSSDEQQEAGVTSDWLDPAQIASRAPFLGSAVTAATFSLNDCFASPLMFAPALIDAAKAAGVRIAHSQSVTAIERNTDGAGYRVRTASASVRCARLVVAAGAWSSWVTRLAGVSLPLVQDINMISVSAPAAPFMQGVVTHVRGILTLKQVANGTCLIGGGWQGAGDLGSDRKDIDYESALHNIRLAISVIPKIKSLMLARQWSGFEGVTPDSCPYLGALPGLPDAFIVACARGGWTLSPILALMLSELMLDGDTALAHSLFDPARFAHA